MAGVRFKAVTAEVTTGTSAKTVVQIVAAANHRIKVDRWGIAFKGVAPTDAPIKVRLLRQTDAGTTSALTPVKNNPGDDEALQVTARHTATAEPTAGDVLETVEAHPQAGYEVILPLTQEIIVPGGTRLGIEVTATVSTSCVAWINGEE